MKTGMKESLQVARDAFSLTSAIQVTVPYYEADDVIVTLTRKHQDSYRVTVDTSDRDMWCLSDHRNVSVTCNPIQEVMPRDVQLYKALVGDTSDQIPGVRLFGDKAWENVYRYAEPYAERLWNLLLADQEDEFFRVLMSVHVEPKFLVKIKSDFANAVMSAHLVNFRDVEILNKHITVGTNDHEALKTLRGRFMI
jgi:5'-3' exonuclease